MAKMLSLGPIQFPNGLERVAYIKSTTNRQMNIEQMPDL